MCMSENVNRKISVCYLVSSLANEGPVNVIYNIIKYIDFEKFNVSIVTFIPERESSILEDFSKFPIKIYQLAPIRKISFYKLYIALRERVNTIEPDLLHAHCPRSLYLLPFLPARYKKAYTIHIYPGLQQKILYGEIKGSIVIWLNHFFTRWCDLPIACSESVAEQYKSEKGWKVLSVPNGVSLEVWNYSPEEKNKLREELGLKKNLLYFIFIGRFSKEKNPDKLVELFRTIDNEKIGLIMLGKGDLWEILKEECPDNILIPGFTRRVYDYLKASDFYISTSDVEGLANTILESMSVGLPMVLSNIPSHEEVLSNFSNGEVGVIVDQHNSSEIKKGMEAVLSMDRDFVRVEVQKKFKEKYTARKMSEQYQSLYEKCFLTKK